MFFVIAQTRRGGAGDHGVHVQGPVKVVINIVQGDASTGQTETAPLLAHLLRTSSVTLT